MNRSGCGAAKAMRSSAGAYAGRPTVIRSHAEQAVVGRLVALGGKSDHQFKRLAALRLRSGTTGTPAEPPSYNQRHEVVRPLGNFPVPWPRKSDSWRPGGHPCKRAFDALKEAGHSPEVIRTYGFAVLPGVTSGARRSSV